MSNIKKQLSMEEYKEHEKSFLEEDEEEAVQDEVSPEPVSGSVLAALLPSPPADLSLIEHETENLYIYHITREVGLMGYDLPDCVGALVDTKYADTIFKLADDFKSSPQRLWVSQQARSVDLNTMTFKNFADLLTGLFQEGGVTSKRVLVLFFFCTDLSVRALKHHMRGAFYEMYKWTLRFLRTRLAPWVNDVGGWDVIFREREPVDDNLSVAVKIAILTLCTLGIVSLSIYIKKSIDS